MFLFELTSGDLSKCEVVENETRERVYNYLYIKRVQHLNELLDFISSVEHTKND